MPRYFPPFQYTLLTEVREIIRQEDLQLFDELIYDKDGLTNLKGCPVDGLSRGTRDMGMQSRADNEVLRDRDEELPLAIPHSLPPQPEINISLQFLYRAFNSKLRNSIPNYYFFP